MKNYFNLLNFREKLNELSMCRLMKLKEFSNNFTFLKNKKIVIIGCGSQGLHQGLNLRDSGLNISYAFRKNSILNSSNSWKNAIFHKFNVGTYEDLIPCADLVINLTPDKEHSSVVQKIQKLMKKDSILGYSHGFNIVEIGEKIRKDITVIMVAPKCPGTEVREEFLKGFGVPALIAVHPKNNHKNIGLSIAKEWAKALGSHKAGILHSSFVAEVKSDLMGEQTILCGMLQACSLVCFNHLVQKGYDTKYSASLLQLGWERLTESMKHGGIMLMLNRISNSAKIRVLKLSKILKKMLQPLFIKHMDDILSGSFSKRMMLDWKNNDSQLKKWRKYIKNSSFESASLYQKRDLLDQEYFDKGTLMIAMLKAGVELSFETMITSGIKSESAYYESLHELPLIANTIARKRLHEMNVVISDTAEYGSHLFTELSIPIFEKFIKKHVLSYDLGESIPDREIDNVSLLSLNNEVYNHPIEKVGRKLRKYMLGMKKNSIKKNIV